LKLICFDCDSTLSSIEGIDELARLRGPDVLAWVEALTRDAMEGRIRIEDVFGRRLDLIRPGRAEVAWLGERYVETVEPTARETVATLAQSGWTAAIVSAGYRQAIEPLARFLGIARIEAVELSFAPDGSYRDFDRTSPCTRSGGKLEVIERLRAELHPERVIMVGDGASDLETRPSVDLFIGFGGFVVRERLRREAGAFVQALAEVPALVRSSA
jgi:phosphoserine phosphatase